MADEKKPGTAVTNWTDEMAKYAVAVAKQETPSSSSISLRSGVLSYQGQPVPNNKLNVVILDYAYENTLYDGKYDPNNVRSPICFAIHMPDDPTKMSPHEMSEEPQHETCEGCPNMKWGSDPGGGRGKACQERRRLIMIPATAAETPDGILAAEVAIMKLPVTSVKLWGQYVNTIATLNRRPPFALITTVGTVPNAKSQFNVTFAQQSALPDGVMGAIMQKREAVRSTLLKGYDPSTDDAKPADNGKAKKY
jgi:hypothetical protein